MQLCETGVVWPHRPTLYKCLSQLTNFVSRSDGLSSDLTLCIEMILLLTSCCMKRCRSSMCFAFFDVPSLIDIDFSALLSVCILMLMRTSNASFMKLPM